MKMKKVVLYKYIISGYYVVDGDDTRRFEQEVEAEDSVQAIKLVIGRLAWKTSLCGRQFKLDTVHYEILNH